MLLTFLLAISYLWLFLTICPSIAGMNVMGILFIYFVVDTYAQAILYTLLSIACVFHAISFAVVLHLILPYH